jgi:hypothetical protein
LSARRRAPSRFDSQTLAGSDVAHHAPWVLSG